MFTSINRILTLFLLSLLLSCSSDELQPQIPQSIKCVLSSETYSHTPNSFSGQLNHTYDEKGNIIQSIANNSHGESGIIDYQNHYDEKGRLSKQERIKEGSIDSYTIYTFFEDGNLKSKEVTQPKTNNITLEEYNKNGDLLKNTFFQPSGISINDYTYNQDFQLTKFHSEIHGKPNLERTYTYNTKGLKTEYTQEVFESKRKSIAQYIYNDEDLLIEEHWHAGTPSSLQLRYTVKHDYEEDKLVSSLKVDDQLPYHEHNIFFYNDQDQVIRVEQTMDGKSYYLFKEISYFPNGQEKKVRDYRADRESNPATNSFLSLTTEYDSDGRVLTRQKSQANGGIEWTWSYVYNCIEVF